MKRLMIVLCVAAVVGLASAAAQASVSVALVPDALNVAPGSTVNVSVNMTTDSPIALAAFNAYIGYDMNVFTPVFADTDPHELVIVKGAVLTLDWDLFGPYPPPTGQLTVGGFTDFTVFPILDTIPVGTGTLFTFALEVNDNAPLGLSALTWTAGFDYAYGADLNEVTLTGSEMSGASINVSPEPTTIIIWSLFCGLGIVFARWRLGRKAA